MTPYHLAGAALLLAALFAVMLAAMARTFGWGTAVGCCVLSLAASALIILVSTWVMA